MKYAMKYIATNCQQCVHAQNRVAKYACESCCQSFLFLFLFILPNQGCWDKMESHPCSICQYFFTTAVLYGLLKGFFMGQVTS